MGETMHAGRTLSWDLPDDPAAVARARRLVRGALAARGLPHMIDDISVVVSELVTNALVHGAPPIRLSLSIGPDAVRGQVHDHGDGRPRCLHVRDDAHHGRGLSIVAALTHEWRYEITSPGMGKVVSFTRHLEPERPVPTGTGHRGGSVGPARSPAV